MNITRFLAHIKGQGVEVRLKGEDRLQLKAKTGALTAEIRERLRQNKSEIIALLKQARQFQARAETGITAISEQEIKPLSFAQERLWFLEQLHPDQAVFLLASGLEMEGHLDIAALHRGFLAVIRRHESLRTAFVERDGRPVLDVLENFTWQFPVVDLVSLQDGPRRQLIEVIGARVSFEPMNPENAPLLRVCLLRLGMHNWVLFIATHHIIADGWSVGVFQRDWAHFYEAYIRQTAPNLAPLPIQFSDYAFWQRRQLGKTGLEKQLAFWRKTLQGLKTLAFPLDFPRPAKPSHKGASLAFHIEPGVVSRLTALARRRGLSHYMVLLATLQTLLQRYTDQSDVTVGSPIGNRNRPELEGLVGMFVNLLTMRGDLSGDPPFEELLDRTKQAALSAYNYQEAPFEKVVDACVRERDFSRHPLFQIQLGLNTTPPNRAVLCGLRMKPPAHQAGVVARMDLSLLLCEGETGLEGILEYSTDLFRAATIERFAEHFKILLNGALANPRARLSRLPLIGETELKFLWENNPTDRPFDPETLHGAFERRARRHPHRIALTHGDRCWTYAHLDRIADGWAQRLHRLGATAESRIGLCLEQGLERVAAILAILKVGGVYVPLDESYPSERLAFMVNDAGLKLILGKPALADRLPQTQRDPAGNGQVVIIDPQLWPLAETPTGTGNHPAPGNSSSPQNLAYLVYTSGTTGNPKGSQISHANVQRLIDDHLYLKTTAEDVFVQLSNVSFDALTFELWTPLLLGARLALIDKQVTLYPERFAELLRLERVSILFVTVALFNQLVLIHPDMFGTLKALYVGGDKMAPEIVRLLFRRGKPSFFHNIYGPTESTTFALYHRLDSAPLENLNIPLGRPIAHTTAWITDRRLNQTPIGVVGELLLGGEGLSRGYLNRPDLTAEKFIPNPFSEAVGTRLYRSGDLSRRLSDGALEFHGRVDHQVKIRGFRVELAEIEMRLANHPDVGAAAVLALEENTGSRDRSNRRLIAYLSGATPLAPADLRTYLQDHLPEYMIPSDFVFLERLPLTPNGKLDRRALPTPQTSEPSLETAFTAPRNAVETQLCDIWERVLGRSRVGIHHNFFDLGGDSLLSIRIRAEARKLSLDFELTHLFEFPTIADLATRIKTEDLPVENRVPFCRISRSERARLPETIEDAYPLAQVQMGLLFQGAYESGTGQYHVILLFHMDLPWDQHHFEQAWLQCCRRHPMLRTGFDLEHFETPLQLVYKEASRPPVVEDLRGRDDWRKRIDLWMIEDRAQPFDWEQPPLLRLRIFRHDGSGFRLGMSFHHAIMDGWSDAALMTELTSRYVALRQGRTLPEEKVPCHYGDFVALERQTLDDPKAWAFWEDLLAGDAEGRLARWPGFDQEQKPQPRSLGFELNGEVLKSLQGLARLANVPFKSVLFAVHVKTMALAFGNRNIITGLAAHGRPESDGGDRVLGLFINTLPFRIGIRRGSWLDLIRQIFELERQMIRFRRFPLAEIVKRGQNRAIFETAFNFNHFHVMDRLRQQDLLGKVVAEGGSSDTNFTLFLNFSLDSEHDRLLATVSYDGSQIGERQARLIADRSRNLLRAMIENPAAAHHAHAFLSGEETRMLRELNQTDWEIPREKTVAEFFEAAAARGLDRTALYAENRFLTYDQLNAGANALALDLRRQGVGPDSLTGLCLKTSLGVPLALLAILKAGGAYLFIDPNYPEKRRAYMVEDAELNLIISEGEQAALFEFLPVTVQGLGPYLQNARTPNAAVRSGPDNLAFVIYTSGSTGRPKGVAISQSAISRLLFSAEYAYFDFRQVVLATSSFSFDASTLEIWKCLVFGGRLCLALDQDVNRYPELIRNQGVTTMWFTIKSFNLLVDEQLAGLTPLGQLTAGGEAFSQTHARKFLEFPGSGRIINAYGPTECTTLATSHQIRPEDLSAKTIPIGKPFSNTRTHILDHDFNPTGLGVPGHLFLGGPGVARGYLNRPGLTAEKFVPDPFSQQAGARLYATGDLVRLLPQGLLEFYGRLDRQVKLRGFRIEPGEIETELMKHQCVKEAVILVDKRPADGDMRLIAYYTLYIKVQPDEAASALSPSAAEPNQGEPDEAGSEPDLRTFLRDRLPDYMVPAAFVELAALPLTINGKLNQKALPLPDFEDAGAVDQPHAPRNRMEEVLADIWCRVLKRKHIGIHGNFFRMGGHSLLATQVVSRIGGELSMSIPLKVLFNHPTIAQLAEFLKESGSGDQNIPDIENLPRDFSNPKQPPGFPLSFAQQRLWFLDQLEEEGSAFYNIPQAARLLGELDAAALERSYQEIERRHESLRTRFVVRDDEPRQLIESPGHLKLMLVDMTGLSAETNAELTAQLTEREAQTPFDLERGPLVRLRLLRLEGRAHAVLLNIHHIIADGWSMGVLNREIASLYEAYTRGYESPLAKLPVQYPDYTLWQRNWLREEVLQEQISYWKEHLDGASLVLELPTDFPRPAVERFRGSNLSTTIPEQLTARLRARAAGRNATLFMVLLATYKLFLHRYSGQEDLVVGTPIANRRHAAIEDLIGFFVNTLVLRTQLNGDPSFDNLLERVKTAAMGGYAHQDVPFENLVEQLQSTRDMSRSPLFQVMFVLQNAPRRDRPLGSLKVEPLVFESGIAKFDLTLFMMEMAGGLTAVLEYNTDLFETATAQRMLEHFQVLLAAVAADPGLPISRLTITTEAERRCLLELWNQTEEPFDLELGFRSRIANQALERPDAVAVQMGPRSVTYAAFDSRANRLAHHLQKRGVGPEAVVGVMMERSLELAVAFLAVVKTGAAVVALDPSYPEQRLVYVIQDAGLRVLLTEHRYETIAPEGLVSILLLDSGEDFARHEPTHQPRVTVFPENLLYVIYTSGSTGMPKGVGVPIRALVNLLTWQEQRTSLHGSQRTLQFAAFGFCVSFQEMLSSWMAGGTLIIAGEDERKDAERLLAYLDRMAVERLHLPFAALKQLAMYAQKAPRLPKHLREIITAGEQLQIIESIGSFFERLPGCRLHNQYGSSETHVITALTLTGDAEKWPVLPSAGRPIANTAIYLLDHRLEPVPTGTPGQIFAAGVALARGYLNRTDLTVNKFVPNPFARQPGDRLYRTGDLARYRANGNIQYMGRADQMVKVRGYRVEPGEIETVLRRHETLADVAVIPLPDESGAYFLAAYVVAAEGRIPKVSALRAYLKTELPPFMIPQAFVKMARLPVTTHGKLDREALPAPAISREASQREYAAPITPVQQILAEIWSQVLKIESIGIHDDFFELGGHSLLATQVISRVRNAFSRQVPLRALFEDTTIAGLARRLENLDRDAEALPPAITPLSCRERLPLSFAQQRLWFLDRLEGPSATYNMPAALRLRGTLDVRILERVLSEVFLRHEVLRTVFCETESRPFQSVHGTGFQHLPLVDLTGLHHLEGATLRQRLIDEEAGRGFDLARGPLFRLNLLRTDARTSVLLATMHHIISDGWSMGILTREIGALYPAFADGEASPLEPLNIQYADFAHWQRQWLNGSRLEEQLTYWKGQLAEIPEMIDITGDFPRPSLKTYRGNAAPFLFPAMLAQGLHTLARRNGATLFMVLETAFAILLSRYSRQTDIVLGSPVANRNHAEIEPLIGFFVNTLVYRNDLRGDPAFLRLLEDTRTMVLDAYTHQDLPFDRLVDELQPQRSLNQTPLFQVLFVLQNTPGGALSLPGLELSLMEREFKTAKFDLSLLAEECPDGLAGMLEYNTDLFGPTFAEAFLVRYRLLLEGIVAAPENPVSQLAWLTEAERKDILETWNNTARTASGSHNLTRSFAAGLQTRPDRIALVLQDERSGCNRYLDYAALREHALGLAHKLRRHGVGLETPVGIYLPRGEALVVSFLAVLFAGGSYVPLDLDYPAERLAYMIEDTGLRLVLTEQEYLQNLNDPAVETLTTEATPPTGKSLPEADSLSLAYIMYTSGSTGVPKGIGVPHSAVLRLSQPTDAVPYERDDVFLALSSTSFDASTFEVWCCLLHGARLVCLPNGAVNHIHRYLENHRISILFLTAQLFNLLVDTRPQAITAVRRVLAGGEALSHAHAERFLQWPASRHLVNGYGPTENTSFANFCDLSRLQPLPPIIPIGRPLADTSAFILDRTGRLLPPGLPGELAVGGMGLARGYLRRPRLTALGFRPNPFSKLPGRRLYYTGDLARFDASGLVVYLGRLDRQVKLRGFRIEPGEIERRLLEYEPIGQAVIALKSKAGGEKELVAYLVPMPDNNDESTRIDPQSARDFLAARLPKFMLPDAWVILENLPLTPNGKLDRAALPDPQRQHETETVPPRDALERDLARIWQELLGVEHLGIHQNFFQSGGHSLLAVRLIALVEQRFGMVYPLSALFREGSIAAMAARIRRGQEQPAEGPLVRLRDGGTRTPLFLVHPGGGNIFCYSGLVAELEPDRPIYAFSARGLSSGEPPLETVEAMASLYLETLRKIRPQGPYHLAGWSFGGMVAFEMARRLGPDQVGGLILLDSWLAENDSARPRPQEAQLAASFAADLAALSGKSLDLNPQHFQGLNAENSLSVSIAKLRAAGISEQELAPDHIARLYAVFRANLLAMFRFRPNPYAGSALYVEARQKPAGHEAPRVVSRRWAQSISGSLTHKLIGGSHYVMMAAPTVLELGDLLEAYLREHEKPQP